MCVCVCLCVQAAHLRLTQLSDKLDILTDLVSCWLQNEFGVFRIIAFWRSYSFRASHGASTQPFSVIYAHALPQWVSGTRVWLYYERARIINPRRACAARVTVVVPCVCVCVCVSRGATRAEISYALAEINWKSLEISWKSRKSG